jgi:hypothetical protein
VALIGIGTIRKISRCFASRDIRSFSVLNFQFLPQTEPTFNRAGHFAVLAFRFLSFRILPTTQERTQSNGRPPEAATSLVFLLMEWCRDLLATEKTS